MKFLLNRVERTLDRRKVHTHFILRSFPCPHTHRLTHTNKSGESLWISCHFLGWNLWNLTKISGILYNLIRILGILSFRITWKTLFRYPGISLNLFRILNKIQNLWNFVSKESANSPLDWRRVGIEGSFARSFPLFSKLWYHVVK